MSHSLDHAGIHQQEPPKNANYEMHAQYHLLHRPVVRFPSSKHHRQEDTLCLRKKYGIERTKSETSSGRRRLEGERKKANTAEKSTSGADTESTGGAAVRGRGRRGSRGRGAAAGPCAGRVAGRVGRRGSISGHRSLLERAEGFVPRVRGIDGKHHALLTVVDRATANIDQ